MKRLLTLLFLGTILPLAAQVNGTGAGAGPLHGTLYVSVDQTAAIFINGAPVKLSKDPRTADVTLGPGDRLVAKISSTHYYRNFAIFFLSDDKQTEISFRRANFKLLPDPQATDFTADQFNDFPKGVTRLDEIMKPDYIARIKNGFPAHNNSEFFWGDRMDSTVGSLITSDMFTPVPP